MIRKNICAHTRRAHMHTGFDACCAYSCSLDASTSHLEFHQGLVPGQCLQLREAFEQVSSRQNSHASVAHSNFKQASERMHPKPRCRPDRKCSLVWFSGSQNLKPEAISLCPMHESTHRCGQSTAGGGQFLAAVLAMSVFAFVSGLGPRLGLQKPCLSRYCKGCGGSNSAGVELQEAGSQHRVHRQMFEDVHAPNSHCLQQNVATPQVS